MQLRSNLRLLRTVLEASTLLLSVSLAQGQSALFFFEGPSGTKTFGSSVGSAGDVNGDGVEDVVVGHPGDSINGSFSGSARVYSGADGGVLHVFAGEDPNDGLGRAIGRGGDVNGDGFDDVVVGVPFDFVQDRGSVRVYSGLNGALLHKFTGLVGGDLFGWSVDCGGDVDGDGLADVIVGAPSADPTRLNSGSAYVFSGATGQLLHQFDGDSKLGNLGIAVAMVEDANGDGFDDLVVGAHREGPGGRAFVFSGVDGSTLLTLDGAFPEGMFGGAVSGAGDVNGDGRGDVIVGTWADGTNGQQSGVAQVFSGADGSVLHSFYGQSDFTNLGASVAGAGDLNGDQLDDLLVGANDGPAGEVRAYSGADGSLLYTFTSGEAGDGLELECASIGDLNGDGINEILAGAWLGDTSNGPDTGAVWVFTVREEVGQNYCGPANLNSSGQSAEIGALGSRVVSLDDLRLEATRTALNQFAMFLNSPTQGLSQPPGSQGSLCLGGAIGRYNQNVMDTGPGGAVSIQLDLANTPTPGGPVSIQAGETWNFQLWFRDSNPGPTSNFTDGVAITFF
jgi:FG-GAP repeat